jgi:epoxide hydrolase-like predicted phosphatase
MSIQAVFFDFGGVLYRVPDRKWMRRMQMLLGLGKDSTFSTMILEPDESPYFQALMEGRITESDMWQRMANAWRLSPMVVGWLRKNTLSRRRVNQQVADFLAGLRPRFKTGILSNAGTDARKMFNEVFGFDRIVDTMVISAEEGVMKPDERIYQIALDRLGVSAPETVFLDDLAVNVDAARRVGIRAVHFQTTAQALAEVGSLLNGHHT